MSTEKTFDAVFDALLLLWRRDYSGERLITDDGSGREFLLENINPESNAFARTDDPPTRTAPLANALVQLWLIRSEVASAAAQIRNAQESVTRLSARLKALGGMS